MIISRILLSVIYVGGDIMFSLLIMIPLAMLFFILGFLVWKKEKINLIHSYHYTKVSGVNI